MTLVQSTQRGTLLVDTHPEIASEWHPVKNADLDLARLGTFSNKKVWFAHRDESGDWHEWQQIIRNRTYEGTGCPECRATHIPYPAKRWPKPQPGHSLGDRFPEVAALLHPTRNHSLTALDLAPHSIRRVWWRCEAGHEWIRTVNRTVYLAVRGTHCQACRCVGLKPNYRVTPPSVAAPHLISEWHPTRNGDLGLDDFISGSKEKVWWKGTCGHEWKASVSSRARDLSGCSKCRGKDAGYRFAAFASGSVTTLAEKYPEIAAEWHPVKNGTLTAGDVSYGSAKKAWWICSGGHVWQQSVNGRTGRLRGCWCCAKPDRVPVPEAIGFGDSVAAKRPDLAEQWHPSRNGLASPETVAARSDQVVWWQCEEGHVWRARPASRVGTDRGCRVCSNTAERRQRGW